MNELQDWQAQAQSTLDQKTTGLFDKHKKKYAVAYISGAIQKVPERIQSEEQLTEFKKNTEVLIESIPDPVSPLLGLESKYLGALNGYKEMLMKQFKMIPANYYIGIFLPIGLCFGVCFGVVFKNIGLGLPLGMMFGLVLGAAMNAKAKKDGRLL